MKIIPRVLCVLFAVLCALSLALTAAAGLAVYSLRKTVTPQSAASAAEAVDFASIRFPDGFGGFTTVPEQMNASFSNYGYSITPEAFNGLCRDLSFDKILGDYLAQFARWFFDYGPTPVFDPEEAARTVVGSMDPGALGMFRDPAGELCGAHQGCRVPFRPPIPNVGLLLRRCSGKGLHLAMTGEPRGFPRVAAGFSSYDGEFIRAGRPGDDDCRQ